MTYTAFDPINVADMVEEFTYGLPTNIDTVHKVVPALMDLLYLTDEPNFPTPDHSDRLQGVYEVLAYPIVGEVGLPVGPTLTVTPDTPARLVHAVLLIVRGALAESILDWFTGPYAAGCYDINGDISCSDCVAHAVTSAIHYGDSAISDAAAGDLTQAVNYALGWTGELIALAESSRISIYDHFVAPFCDECGNALALDNEPEE